MHKITLTLKGLFTKAQCEYIRNFRKWQKDSRKILKRPVSGPIKKK